LLRARAGYRAASDHEREQDPDGDAPSLRGFADEHRAVAAGDRHASHPPWHWPGTGIADPAPTRLRDAVFER
jgi:hypothetical protein